MEVRSHDSVSSFLDAAGPLLLRDEARHNLIFGICTTLAESPGTYPDFHLWTVDAEGETTGAAVMTPPFNVVVAQPTGPAAQAFLADALHRRGVPLPGVTAAVPEADLFVESWERLTGMRSRLRMAQGIYAVRAPRIPEGVSGTMRSARTSDRDLLVSWIEAFAEEALPEGAPRHDAEPMVDRRLDGGRAGFALWEDGGEPVSLSGFGGETPHGTRIGPVYTPPPLRRRGYAGALVAQLSRRLLDEGRDYCFLYTDLANPTSNRVYVKVGYEFVCESRDYVFEAG